MYLSFCTLSLFPFVFFFFSLLFSFIHPFPFHPHTVYYLLSLIQICI